MDTPSSTPLRSAPTTAMRPKDRLVTLNSIVVALLNYPELNTPRAALKLHRIAQSFRRESRGKTGNAFRDVLKQHHDSVRNIVGYTLYQKAYREVHAFRARHIGDLDEVAPNLRAVRDMKQALRNYKLQVLDHIALAAQAEALETGKQLVDISLGAVLKRVDSTDDGVLRVLRAGLLSS